MNWPFFCPQMGAQNAWAPQSRWSQRTRWVPWAGAGRPGRGQAPKLPTVPSLHCPLWWSWRTCWSSRWGGPAGPEPLQMKVSALPECGHFHFAGRDFRNTLEPHWWGPSTRERMSPFNYWCCLVLFVCFLIYIFFFKIYFLNCVCYANTLPEDTWAHMYTYFYWNRDRERQRDLKTKIRSMCMSQDLCSHYFIFVFLVSKGPSPAVVMDNGTKPRSHLWGAF